MGNIIVDIFTVLIKCIYYILQACVFLVTPNSWRYKDVAGQKVLITGAGSGLGRGLSIEFAKRGCVLVLWDMDSDGNAETARMVREAGAVAHTYTINLVNRQLVYDVADQVSKDVGDIDILVNNAGIVTGKRFLDCPDHLIQRTMDVNTLAHFWTVKSFLPAMIARNFGHIVTVSSSAGFFGVNGMADYCASKYAAVGFHEALVAEFDALGLDGIKTTLVCPYYIDTGMFRGLKLRIPFLKQSAVIDSIIDAILANKYLLIVPWYLNLILALKGLIPVKCGSIFSDALGMSTAMDEFEGRGKKD